MTETSLSEFSLINRFFANGSAERDDVLLGVGDDAALVRAGSGHQVLTALATQSGDIFGASPARLGKHALAAALTRVAAMGAKPAWASLALTLADADTQWLSTFSNAFLDLARRYDVSLVGGDTTRGKRTVTVFVQGLAPRGRRLGQCGAQPGDAMYVIANQDPDEPPANIGSRLLSTASAATDVTGSLAAAVSELERAGGVTADIEHDRIPPELRTGTAAAPGHCPGHCPEYWICFTAPAEASMDLDQLGDEARCFEVGTVHARCRGLG